MTTPRRRAAQRRREKETGSLNLSEPVFVVVAILRRPHGLHGEMLASIETDFPERLQPGTQVFLGEEHRPVTIAGRRSHNDGLLLTFEEQPGEQSIDSLRNVPVFVRTQDRPPLPEGEYYQHQLLGLNVVEENGEPLGTLVQILDTGANQVYVVKTKEDKELLLPALKNVIRQITLDEGRMVVRLLPGLREVAGL